MPDTAKQCLVAGVGNRLMGDDAAGSLAAQALRQRALPEGVVVVDEGTDAVGLAEALCRTDCAVIMDAASMGAPAGTVRVFTLDQARALPAGAFACLHQFGPIEAVDLAAALGKSPPIAVAGIQPASMLPGEELTPAVRSGLAALEEAALEAAVRLLTSRTRIPRTAPRACPDSPHPRRPCLRRPGARRS